MFYHSVFALAPLFKMRTMVKKHLFKVEIIEERIYVFRSSKIIKRMFQNFLGKTA